MILEDQQELSEDVARVEQLVDPRRLREGQLSARVTRHTVTVLNDGQVLVAGGNDFKRGGTTASAELYTP